MPESSSVEKHEKLLENNFFSKSIMILLNFADLTIFPQQDFKENLREALYDGDHSYDDFDHIFTTRLNRYAPKQ